MYYKLLFCCLLALLNSCSHSDTPENKNNNASNKPVVEHKKKYIEIVTSDQTPSYNLEDTLKIEFKLKKKNTTVDSIILLCGKTLLPSISWNNQQVNTVLKDLKLGQNSIRLGFYFNDSLKENHYYKINVLSNIVPKKYTYKIVKIHKHDIHSFTQGLVYEDGLLYEGTGHEGESRLYKYSLEDNKVLANLRLKNDLFGEGIAIFDDKVIQLTWRSNVGFIYDKNTFNLIQKIYYESKQGWGITYDGEKLIMSDGSHIIYFMDKEYFTEIDRIEIYDNKGFVDSLNELEYVNGEIYANIWRTDEIIVIDPKSGAVKRKIDMSGLLSESDKHQKIDVLNGIAYNPEAQLFYVTGKYWPKLFEVKFVPQ